MEAFDLLNTIGDALINFGSDAPSPKMPFGTKISLELAKGTFAKFEESAKKVSPTINIENFEYGSFKFSVRSL